MVLSGMGRRVYGTTTNIIYKFGGRGSTSSFSFRSMARN
jgi:hypothetical protein